MPLFDCESLSSNLDLSRSRVARVGLHHIGNRAAADAWASGADCDPFDIADRLPAAARGSCDVYRCLTTLRGERARGRRYRETTPFALSRLNYCEREPRNADRTRARAVRGVFSQLKRDRLASRTGFG